MLTFFRAASTSGGLVGASALNSTASGLSAASRDIGAVTSRSVLEYVSEYTLMPTPSRAALYAAADVCPSRSSVVRRPTVLYPFSLNMLAYCSPTKEISGWGRKVYGNAAGLLILTDAVVPMLTVAWPTAWNAPLVATTAKSR